MNIKKKHKLYFRTKDGIIRRLDKTTPQIYDFILKEFIEGDAEKRYKMINKDGQHWSKFKPIPMPLPKDHGLSFKILQNAVDSIKKPSEIEISYNGSWRPLVNLRMSEFIKK